MIPAWRRILFPVGRRHTAEIIAQSHSRGLQVRSMDFKTMKGKKMAALGLLCARPGRLAILLVLQFLLLAGAVDAASGGSGKPSKGSSDVQQGLADESAEAGGVLVRPPKEVLQEIHIPRAAEAFFNSIYARRHQEIRKFIDDNPEMIWPAISLFLDALPALRAIPQNGGRLLVDRRVYAEAEQFMVQCEKKVSPEFGVDLRKMKDFIEKRTKHIEGQRMAIDLN